MNQFHVPRIEDLPYYDSPPIQFIWESTAPLLGGMYTWRDAPGSLVSTRPLLDNAMYYFRSVSLVADISEIDFESNLVVTPLFYVFLKSDAGAVAFREPIQMNKYYDQFDYRFLWTRAQQNNHVNAAFSGLRLQTVPPPPTYIEGGVLMQGPALSGKLSITLKAIISAQEIVNEHFINAVRKHGYPDVGAGLAPALGGRK